MVPSDASTTSFTWTASANGTEYRLQIRAFAGSSPSPASNTARATPRAATVLLNNIGGVFSGTTGSDEYATPFTTGTHPYGYTISEVVIFLSSNANASNPALVATIRERGSGNRPGDLVATLINPSTLMTARNTFTTPPGTALSPNTTYYLVFNDGNAGTQPVRTARFVRPGDKQGGAADWNLPDNGSGDPVRSLRKQTSPSNPWGSIPSRLLFSISGNPIDYAPTVVDNPAPLHDGPCIPWTYGTPRGYCSAKQTAGASDNNVGSDLLLAGNPAAFIETESGEKDVHGRTILEIRETSCGTNTGSFRIRTLNWRFPGPPAVADPKVWVVATTGERWVSHGPGNERFRSAAPRMIAGGAKLRLDGEYGLPVPVAPHDGEGVVEVNFTVESDTNDSFEFQLLASRDANQKYNMLGWIGGGITGNTRRPVLAEDAAWGPTVHVEFIKNRNLSCPDAMSGSNSPPETQNTPPDAVIIGQGQPEVIAEGVPSDDESPYAAVLADAEKAVTETDKGEIHVDRWHRVLAALGVDNGHTPMPASEAQGYVDRGWTRWVPVAAALAEIESGTQPEPETQPTTETEPVRCVSDELKADVTGWSQETVSTNTELQSAYVERWLRVLRTFAGTANDSTIMLPAEARTYRDKGWARWIPVVAALECLEERAAE